MANQKKRNIVNDFSQLLETYKHFIVIEYEKTTHQSLEDLRKKLRETGARVKVLKNSLFDKSVEAKAYDSDAYKSIVEKQGALKGPSVFVGFPEDWSTSLKKYYEETKKNPTLRFKFGFIESDTFNAKGVEALAKLPSRQELVATVIGNMKGPLSKTTYALKFNTQRFVTVLTEASKK